jgi:hypothetical protein
MGLNVVIEREMSISVLVLESLTKLCFDDFSKNKMF